ncbi:glycosyltransferase family 1 protein [Moniliophthora roreri MCA 2997]|uniref:sterol 3beta-glucosyltransferase n=1 Tax=Moniliophthora roreri (strain MCA 2997) TaxID=1381753 RepID=V2XMM5_MONRO|nr:glycosyltransferase family 1 protein [Moniliophthora roreri MCA 2997]
MPRDPSSERSSSERSFDERTTESFTTTPPTISRIYADADAFEQVLENCNAVQRRDSDPEPDGFTRLIGKHLNSTERAVVDRSAKLDVAGPNWVDGDLTSEPKSIQSETGSEEAGERSKDLPVENGIQFHRSSTLQEKDSESWTFDSHEILRLLVQEFGTLAQGIEQEQVILEADGVMLVGGVSIVGVIHLTTHRLSFHASLLSSHPEIGQRTLKSGPAVLHFPRKRAKRRWIELSDDMMSVYASSRDQDRIRPRQSVLLSHVVDVLPYDTKQPRSIQVKFHDGDIGKAEFDTIESALTWRREFEAALFLDRHRRREALSDSEDSSGIRLSCPLDRITKVQTSLVSPHYKHRVSALYLEPNPENQSQILYIGPIIPSPQWDSLEELIGTAKKRCLTDSGLSANERPVVIDFGPLTFTAKPHTEPGTTTGPEDEIRLALALGSEPDVWIVPARIYLRICTSGHFVVSNRFVGFWGKSAGLTDVSYRLPATIVKSARCIGDKFWVDRHGLALEVEGYPDLKFQFRSREVRDEAVLRVNNAASAKSPLSSPPWDRKQFSTVNNSTSVPGTPTSPSTTPSLSGASSGSTAPTSVSNRSSNAVHLLSPSSRTHAVVHAASVNLQSVSILHFPKAINLDPHLLPMQRTLHFVCLTIGSRGDVQPYIALGLGLKKEGHIVTIVTHEEYRGWIESFGLEHRTAGGDPGALMKLSVEHKMFSPEFFSEGITKFRPWLDQLLVDAWEACKDADVLLESPSAMAGVHIAEALRIPYFRTFTMPWTKTAEFPHAFLWSSVESHTFNSISNVMWSATSGQINRWRTNTLKIGSTDMNHLAESKIVFIYNFSQAVVPKPLDWADTTTISGYWFLDSPESKWTPAPELLKFMTRAQRDGKPLVYIGFGSITVPHPNRVTLRIIKAVKKADVRAIISKGWSSRMSKEEEVEVNEEEVYVVDQIPHDWLFERVDAVLHHGGAGTTGASLRAGKPTLIKPWFGDQFFWASRVQKLGAGLRVSSLGVNDLAEALVKATSDRIMKEKAAAVGERIRAEDGVRTAIRTIYTYLDRASQDRTLLDKHAQK